MEKITATSVPGDFSSDFLITSINNWFI